MEKKGFDVTVATKKDLQDLFALSHEFAKDRVMPPNPDKIEAGHKVLVAKVGGKIVGFAHYGPHIRGTGKIFGLAVIKEKRFRYIGNILLEVAVRKLMKKHRGVFIREATGSEKFYEKVSHRLGAKIVGPSIRRVGKPPAYPKR